MSQWASIPELQTVLTCDPSNNGNSNENGYKPIERNFDFSQV